MKRIFSKKTIALLLVTTMTGSLLSGCGSGGSGGNGGSSAGYFLYLGVILFAAVCGRRQSGGYHFLPERR